MSLKYIFVTGGVCSGLGKGIVSASIGSILKNSGYEVVLQKLDPYLNVDPGTMSPFQHGEVFVTSDGAETDLDLGHYERFTDVNLSIKSSVTAGQVYNQVLNEERLGKHLGETIQIVPHITDKIKKKITFFENNSKKYDFAIIEIGGTVGDIEGLAFLEAIRQLWLEKGPENVLFVHLTLVPFLSASKEQKTKPTQQSVKMLNTTGIKADIIIPRHDYPIDQSVINKIALFSNVPKEYVIPVQTLRTIYEVPLLLEKFNLSKCIAKKFNIPWKKPNLKNWESIVKIIYTEKPIIKIGIAGKYVDLEDSYISVSKAVKDAGYHLHKRVVIEWIDTEKIEKDSKLEWEKVRSVDGIIIPGGFGDRGIEGKISIAGYCRENNVSYLGLCLGFQMMIVDYARNVLNLENANSLEFNENTKYPVVNLMENQKNIKNKGGTMRLGDYKCNIKKGTKAYDIYKKSDLLERHRHRYEFNNKYLKDFEKEGFILSGVCPENNLIEIGELKNHKFMIGVQFHPEFLSRPYKPHPLFTAFLKSIIK